jgi:ElaA protein
MGDRLIWQWRPFEGLSIDELYDILGLRQLVFCVEQRCPYLDTDGYDRHALHLMGKNDDSRLLAYLRLIIPGRRYDEASIGRVVTHPDCRGKGFGRLLMYEGIRKAGELFPGQAIRIAAQCYLEKFYGEFGFVPAGERFDEDGIMHVIMVRGGEPA